MLADDNPFELHFSLWGPAGSPYSDGIYHGVLALAENYPFEPPSVIFMTPSGRFKTDKPICLSSSTHHAELWQPSWSIRMFMISLRAFFLEVQQSCVKNNPVKNPPSSSDRLVEP